MKNKEPSKDITVVVMFLSYVLGITYYVKCYKHQVVYTVDLKFL
jgi:hypothetical protein